MCTSSFAVLETRPSCYDRSVPSAAVVVIATLAAACSSPGGGGPSSASPVERWDLAALCGPPGASVAPAAEIGLIPLPARFGLAAPFPLASSTVAAGTRELALRSFARMAAEAGLTIAPDTRATAAALTVHALGPAGFDAIQNRCRMGVVDGEEAFFLVARARPYAGAGAEVIIAARTERGGARATALLAQLFERTTAGPTLREAWINDAPQQAVRGVLEGFYGEPWAPEERLEMLRFTWRMRMNMFVWAPKNELTSRLLWRFDHSDELLAHLAALAREADALGVELCAALSPGGGILYSDPAERQLVIAKMRKLASIGATCLLLAFDDIPRELRPEDRAAYPGGIGEAHADLAAGVFAVLAAELPAVRLGFVPTDYWTFALDEHPEYVRAVAPRLPPGVRVGWTGLDIVSSTVTAAHVRDVTARWGRAPFFGDNYPVVDGSRRTGRIQLGPIVGREPAAVLLSSGWIANAMPLPRASQVALATIAELAWNPERYEAGDAWSRALTRIGGPARQPLELLARHARGSVLDTREAVELDGLAVSWLDGFPREHEGLRAHLVLLASLDAEATIASLGPVGAEIDPWARQLAGVGRAGLQAMDLAARGRPDPPALAALEQEIARLESTRVEIATEVSRRFLRGALAKLRAAL